MNKYSLDEQAEQDLDEIWLTIAEDSPNAAYRMIDRLTDSFVLLAGQPLIGRERPELAPNLRSFPVSSYMIFYRPITNGVGIARVLHGSRDIDALFRN